MRGVVPFLSACKATMGRPIVACPKRNCNDSRSCSDELNVQADGYLVAYENPAGFEGRVPSERKVFPVDSRCGGEPDARIPPWIFLRHARSFDIKNHFSGYSVNREIARNRQFPRRLLRTRGRFEANGRKLLHVKEIRALEMRVPLRVPRIDSGGVDRSLDFGFGDVVVVQFQTAGDGGEFSLHVRDHHMLDLELGRGVNRIDVPGADTYFGPNFGANCGVHFLSSPVL